MAKPKFSPFYGPRQVAGYSVRYMGYVGGSDYTTREYAVNDARQAQDAGKLLSFERNECCPYPGCSGGKIRVVTRKRTIFPTYKPCPQCAESEIDGTISTPEPVE